VSSTCPLQQPIVHERGIRDRPHVRQAGKRLVLRTGQQATQQAGETPRSHCRAEAALECSRTTLSRSGRHWADVYKLCRVALDARDAGRSPCAHAVGDAAIAGSSS
jgi:hypothetical protein